MSRLYVGGLLALALLVMYLYALAESLIIARSCSGAACNISNSGISYLLQTIGALVSAVVISELSVTRPGEAPGSGIAAAVGARKQTGVVKTLTSVYIMVWLVAGIFLVVFGWGQPSTPQIPEVVSAAKEWLGFAIAAAYAYFGVSPAPAGQHRA